MSVVIQVNNVSKKYQLGRVGTQSFRGDFQRWWAKRIGKEDPFTKVTEEINDKSGEFWALRDVSFKVEQGDAVGIIGKNGAGKSTLLKILSRITLPTTGSIKAKGRIASLLEVGTGFNPDLTGRENIFLNAAILGMTKQEVKQKFDEIVDFSGVEKFIDTPVKRYSSGMYVRLAFAVAAHLESEILILDEVLAVGDAEFQKKCLGKMDDVAHKQGRTILFVSHSIGMVKTICNKGVFLKQGIINKLGDVQDVIEAYLETAETKNDVISAIAELKIDELLPAQIVKVILTDSSGKPTTTFDVFEQIKLEIEYIIREEEAGLDLGLILERNGETLAVSFDTDRNPERLHKRKPGYYKVVVSLPCPLKAGGYKIANVGIGKTNVGPININKDILSFTIEEQSFDASLKSYAAKRPGVIVADLEWKLVSYEILSQKIKVS
jgi:lipopolysaccharide transport system ATP-binding protein